MRRAVLLCCVLSLTALPSPAALAADLDLVVDGKPVATIVVDPAVLPAQPAPGKRPAKSAPAKPQKGRGTPGDLMAAQTVADWLRKISGAELPIADKAPDGAPAIYIGQAAIKAGLKLDDIDSPTSEGLRVQCDGRRVLLAGQDDVSTVKAACRLLEELGCRYLMDHPLGEVHPRTPTVRLKPIDVKEKPGFAIRQIWGSQWGGHTLWKIWNGAGGLQLSQGHSWGKYVPKDLFATHPEYFALRAGQRKQGDWYCTSNPELRKVFADNVIKALDGGAGSASISPPDGVAYCECDACRAQDDPRSIEPSSGRVCVTNRYVDFFNDVAKQVRARHPDARLNFYCYADYTQAPTGGRKLEPGLVAWVAPLRYCRLHAIGNQVCPSRVQLQQMLDGWAAAMPGPGAIAYRTYNYNLAECVVPFSLASVWAHDIPYLKKQGALGINLETLPCWTIYAPHIYLSIRLAYDPAADANAILSDYFDKFCGPAAGPIVRQYWDDVDKAFATLPVHSGSFYSVHNAYTPEFLARCKALLERAAAAAKVDEASAARVALFAAGLENAARYIDLRAALNAGQPARAHEIYQKLLAHAEAQVKAGTTNRYTPDYLKRFVGKHVEAAAAACAAPNRVAAVLPDQWKLAYDEADKGLKAGYARPDFDDSAWKSVATYSDTLNAQGLPDRQTILWYRTTVELPAAAAPARALFFVEVDGLATVYINGQEAAAGAKKRTPFEVDAAALRPGRNTIAVRVDHSGITELFLGGIIRPVYVVEKPAR